MPKLFVITIMLSLPVWALGQTAELRCPAGRHFASAESTQCVPDAPKIPAGTLQSLLSGKIVEGSLCAKETLFSDPKQVLWDALRTRVITDDEMDEVLGYGAGIVPAKDGGILPVTSKDLDYIMSVTQAELVLLQALKLQFEMRLAEKSAATPIVVSSEPAQTYFIGNPFSGDPQSLAYCHSLQAKGYTISCYDQHESPSTEGVHGWVTEHGFVHEPIPKCDEKAIKGMPCEVELPAISCIDGKCLPTHPASQSPKDKP